MPVLVGKEGKAASMRKRCGRTKPEPAETGRPETSREFASRMKGHILLRGPREQTEGKNSKQKAENAEDKRKDRLTI